MSGWEKATPLCEHWGHAEGEWKYACCACSGMPGGCEHCETDWDGSPLWADGVVRKERDNHAYWASVCTCGMSEQERTGHYPEHEDWCDVPSPMDDETEETP